MWPWCSAMSGSNRRRRVVQQHPGGRVRVQDGRVAVGVGGADRCGWGVDGADDGAVPVDGARRVGVGERSLPVRVEQADVAGQGDGSGQVQAAERREAFVGGEVVVA